MGIPHDGRRIIAVEFISEDESHWFIEISPQHARQLARQLTEAAMLVDATPGRMQ